MNRSEKALRLIALLTVCVMMLSLAACASGGATAAASSAATTAPGGATTAASGTASASASAVSTPEPTQQEPTTITVLAGSTDLSDYADSRVQQELTKKTGVKLQIQQVDDDKLNVLLAGGDLPDMVRIGFDKFDQLIEGNNVIPLQSLLDSNGKNIEANAKAMLAVSKSFWSDGKNQVYYIPVQIGKSNIGMEISYGLIARWDYYKEMNYPTVNSLDDFLNVLAQMVKAHPTTADGKKAYGVSAFSDWGAWPYSLPCGTHEVYSSGYGNTEMLNISNNEMMNCLTTMDSYYWLSIDYYRKANQLGILDPDSFTQKYDDFHSKITSGQIYSVPALWCADNFNSANVSKGIGFAVIPAEFGYGAAAVTSLLGWFDKCFSITTNCKNPTKAMDFLDYIYSFDGCRTLYSGVKGIDWDTVDGKTSLTDATIKLEQAGGDDFKKTGIGFDSNYIGLAGDTINPADNKPLNLFDDPTFYSVLLNNLQKDYCKHYNIEYPAQIVEQQESEGKLKPAVSNTEIANAMMPTTPQDNVTRIDNNLQDLMIKYGAKMILSGSDSEFNTIKGQAIAAFKSAGVQQVADWYSEQWQKALAKAATITFDK